MKKVSGSVFRPWDCDRHQHQQPLVGPTHIKTELPAHQTAEDDVQLVKKELEDEEEVEEELGDQNTRRRPEDGRPADGHGGLESGLAIAMRGLVGAAGGRPATQRWNLGSCLRGLVMGGAHPPPRPPFSAPPPNRLEDCGDIDEQHMASLHI